MLQRQHIISLTIDECNINIIDKISNLKEVKNDSGKNAVAC